MINLIRMGGFVMVCPRCGADINDQQRYCMKCGALNYEHPDNKKMKSYITDEELNEANEEYQKQANPEQTIEIGGKVYSDVVKTDKKSTYVDTRVMLGLLLFITIGLGAIYYFLFPYSITMTLSLCILFFLVVFVILTTISIYMKSGYSGFSFFLPFYSQYAYSDIVFGKGWLFFLFFVPGVNVIYLLYSVYRLGKNFNRGPWLTLFFPFIILPIVAFSDRAIYVGPSKQYKKYTKRGKKRNTKMPAFVCSVLLFMLFVVFSQTPWAEDVANYFVQKDIEIAKNAVERDIRDGLYSCGENILTSEDGDFYILADDLSDVLSYPIPMRSSLSGKKLFGYFYIQVSDRKAKVFPNFTDGEQVFSAMDIDLVENVKIPDGVVVCTKEG